MADIGLRAAAIQSGELDYLEYAPFDYISNFLTDLNLVIARAGGRALIMGTMLMNHTQPPFDNVLVRRAVQETMDRSEILAGLGLPGDSIQPDCTSLFMCGTTYSSDAVAETVRRPSMDRAKALLREAAYTGQRAVVLLPSDSALIYPIGLVMIDRLKQAGFNIYVQDLGLVVDRSTAAAKGAIGSQRLEHGAGDLPRLRYGGADRQPGHRLQLQR